MTDLLIQRSGAPGHEIPVAVVDGTSVDLRPLTADIDGGFWSGVGITGVRDAVERGRLPPIATGGRLGPPIARPTAVICIGMNYRGHAAETKMAVPSDPVIFLKHPNTLCGPEDPIVHPGPPAKLDWEAELGVIVGRRAHRLSDDDDPYAYVGGYVLSQDLSDRYAQIEVSGGQWSRGKCNLGFNPTGPWLLPADAVPDPHRLAVRSFVNGEPRQDSTTGDMIFRVDELIRDLSRVMVLEPGDLINTGTPEGVGLSGRFPYLQPGDRVRCEIDRLGAIDQRVVAA